METGITSHMRKTFENIPTRQLERWMWQMESEMNSSFRWLRRVLGIAPNIEQDFRILRALIVERRRSEFYQWKQRRGGFADMEDSRWGNS